MGGVLQGYALKTLLETSFLNCKAELIYYRYGRNVVYSNKVKQALQYGPVDIIRKLYAGFSKNPIGTKIKTRKELFRSFTNSCAENKKVYSDENLEEAAMLYDCLICGSDQIWNPNVSQAGFYLKGIGRECRKVAYAASIARDDLSEYERSKMLPLIGEFDHISVREATAKRILDKYMPNGKPVYEVLDPALMLTKEQWHELIKETPQKYDNYVLSFFFSESYEYREIIAKYCAEKGLKQVFIPFAAEKYIKSDEQGDCIREFDVGPKEFVSLIANASAIFTDSFHGAVFSILMQKPFCVFERDKAGKVSKNSRLYDLLAKFDLSDRLVKDPATASDVIETPIKFNEIEAKLNIYRASSLDFLRNALEGIEPKKGSKRVDQLIKSDCCGCGLCAQNCPVQCITMKADEEGFMYPLIDAGKCIDCGACVRGCIGKIESSTNDRHDAYVGYNSIEDIRKQSSSGGVFYDLAQCVILDGGAVYGAAYGEDFSVTHTRVDAIEDLGRVMTSKYAQSSITEIYSQIENDLLTGRKVLFVGTPCQVGAVQSYVEKKKLSNDGLLLVDFVCHGVPSPAVFCSYLQYILKGNQPADINFRDKEKGWHGYAFTVQCTNGKKFSQGHDKNVYMHTFLSDKNLRRSCYDCKYKADRSVADITIGDAWNVEKVAPQWADDKGSSLIIVRTEKGRTMIETLPKTFKCVQTDYDIWKRYNPSMVSSTLSPSGRKTFFESFVNEPTEIFWKNQKIPTKNKVKSGIKAVMRVTGIGNMIRKKV